MRKDGGTPRPSLPRDRARPKKEYSYGHGFGNASG